MKAEGIKYPGLIFQEVFNSRQSVEKNGGNVVDEPLIIFKNGTAETDGTANGIINYGNINSLKNVECTVRVRFYLQELADSNNLVLCGKYLTTGDKREWIIYIEITTNKLVFTSSPLGTNAGNEDWSTTSAAFTNNDIGKIQDVVFVKYNSGVQASEFYINGIEVASGGQIVNNVFSGSADFTIGGLSNASYTNQKFDRVEIYNRPLTASEIYNFHNGIREQKADLFNFTTVNGSFQEFVGKDLTINNVEIAKSDSYSALYNQSDSYIIGEDDFILTKVITGIVWVNPKSQGLTNPSRLLGNGKLQLIFSGTTGFGITSDASTYVNSGNGNIDFRQLNFIAFTRAANGDVELFRADLFNPVESVASGNSGTPVIGTSPVYFGNNSALTTALDGFIPCVKIFEGIKTIQEITEIWQKSLFEVTNVFEIRNILRTPIKSLNPNPIEVLPSGDLIFAFSRGIQNYKDGFWVELGQSGNDAEFLENPIYSDDGVHFTTVEKLLCGSEFDVPTKTGQCTILFRVKKDRNTGTDCIAGNNSSNVLNYIVFDNANDDLKIVSNTASPSVNFEIDNVTGEFMTFAIIADERVVRMLQENYEITDGYSTIAADCDFDTFGANQSLYKFDGIIQDIRAYSRIFSKSDLKQYHDFWTKTILFEKFQNNELFSGVLKDWIQISGTGQIEAIGTDKYKKIFDFQKDALGSNNPLDWSVESGSVEIKEVNIEQGELIDGELTATGGFNSLGDGIYSYTSVGTVSLLYELNIVSIAKLYELRYTVVSNPDNTQIIGDSSSYLGTFNLPESVGTHVINDIPALTDDFFLRINAGQPSGLVLSGFSIKEIPTLPQLTTGHKYLEQKTAGITARSSTQSHGVWYYKVRKTADANNIFIPFISDRINTLSKVEGYAITATQTERITLYRSYTGGNFVLAQTAVSYIDFNTDYDLKIVRLASEGVFEDIPTLQVSDCVNLAYSTFTSNGRYGFSAISDGVGSQSAGTADEISIVSGAKYLVEFNVVGTINSSLIELRSSLGGSIISNNASIIEGRNSHIITATSTTTGVLQFRTSSTITDSYEISGLTIRRIYDAHTFAVFIKGGSFGTDSWTLVDVTGGSGTNPVTDSTYTESKYIVTDLDADDRLYSVETVEYTDKFWKQLTAGINAYPQQSNCFEIYTKWKKADTANNLHFALMSDGYKGITQDKGYLLTADVSERLVLSLMNTGLTSLFTTNIGYITNGEIYETLVQRRKTKGTFPLIPTLNSTGMINGTDARAYAEVEKINNSNFRLKGSGDTCNFGMENPIAITAGEVYQVLFDPEFISGFDGLCTFRASLTNSGVLSNLEQFFPAQEKVSIFLTITSTNSSAHFCFTDFFGHEYWIRNLEVRKVYDKNTIAAFIKSSGVWGLIPAAVGSNPVTDNTITSSEYFYTDADADDEIHEVQIFDNLKN